jgi:hypothetical protein
MAVVRDERTEALESPPQTAVTVPEGDLQW